MRDLSDIRFFLLLIPISIVILGFCILALPEIFPNGSLSRFSLRFFDYLSYTLPRLPHDHFWGAIAGQFFSPGKGLFIYSPMLILSLITPFIRGIRERTESIIYLIMLLALTIVQALIYNDEWWNITWGTRALLPVLPLVFLASLPTIDIAINNRQKWIRIGVFTLFVGGTLIQISRLLYSDPAYVNWVVNHTGRGVDAAMQWDWNLMPLFRHWQLAFLELASDIAWLHLSAHDLLFYCFLLLSVAAVGISLYLLLRKTKPNKVFIPVGLAIAAFITAPIIAKRDLRYHENNPEFQNAKNALCKIADDSDLILIDSYLLPFWWYYSNFGCIGPSWLGLPYIHKTAILNDYFYPRSSDLSQLIRDWLPDGDVYLTQMNQYNYLPYTQLLEDAGFTAQSLAEMNNLHGLIYVIEQ